MNTEDRKDVDVLLSIIVLSYNNAEYISDCIDSICNQNIENYEVIVVDDGSTDNSRKVLEEYASHNSKIINVFKENEGGAVASSVGLEKAKGKYCAIVDSDDIVADNAYIKLIKFAEKEKVDFVLGRPLRLNGSIRLEELPDVDEASIFLENKVCETDEERASIARQPYYWNGIYRRDFLNENEIRMPAGLLIADRIFLYKAIIRSRKIGIITDVVYYWRRKSNSDNMSLMDQINKRKFVCDRLDSFSAQINLTKEETNEYNSRLIDIINGLSIKRLFYPFFWEKAVQERFDELYDLYYAYVKQNESFFIRQIGNNIVREKEKKMLGFFLRNNKNEMYKYVCSEIQPFGKIEKKIRKKLGVDNELTRRTFINGIAEIDGRLCIEISILQNEKIIEIEAFNRITKYKRNILPKIDEQHFAIDLLGPGTYLLVGKIQSQNGEVLRVKFNKISFQRISRPLRLEKGSKVFRAIPKLSMIEIYEKDRYSITKVEEEYHITVNKPELTKDLFYFNGKNNQRHQLTNTGKVSFAFSPDDFFEGKYTLICEQTDNSFCYVNLEEISNKNDIEFFTRIVNKGRIEIVNKQKNAASYDVSKYGNNIIRYWWNTFKKKEKDIWIFSGFKGEGYIDNTKYFYEYVLSEHPEIRAFWITKDENVFEMLKKDGKPVLKMGTKECRDIVSRASVGVSDHYRMSDFDIASGLNDRLKIVQLWHGVSLKDFAGLLQKTTVRGINYDHSMISSETGKIKKPIKYFFDAPRSELFEKYIIFMCPGDEQRQKVVKDAHIQYSSCLICGFPRNCHLHTDKPDNSSPKIIYGPTYRWDKAGEDRMISMLVDAGDKINALMDDINGSFTVRLHPHTWRNYGRILIELEKKYPRIFIDREKDIYKTIGSYSMIVSDYSSIAMDFVLVDRPCVFLDFDREEFIKNEGGFSMDYDEYSPGPKAKSWDEVLQAIREYVDNPKKDAEWRHKVRDVFYDMDVNDENNSERVVNEIKRRIEFL